MCEFWHFAPPFLICLQFYSLQNSIIYTSKFYILYRFYLVYCIFINRLISSFNTLMFLFIIFILFKIFMFFFSSFVFYTLADWTAFERDIFSQSWIILNDFILLENYLRYTNANMLEPFKPVCLFFPFSHSVPSSVRNMPHNHDRLFTWTDRNIDSPLTSYALFAAV